MDPNLERARESARQLREAREQAGLDPSTGQGQIKLPEGLSQEKWEDIRESVDNIAKDPEQFAALREKVEEIRQRAEAGEPPSPVQQGYMMAVGLELQEMTKGPAAPKINLDDALQNGGNGGVGGHDDGMRRSGAPEAPQTGPERAEMPQGGTGPKEELSISERGAMRLEEVMNMSDSERQALTDDNMAKQVMAARGEYELTVDDKIDAICLEQYAAGLKQQLELDHGHVQGVGENLKDVSGIKVDVNPNELPGMGMRDLERDMDQMGNNSSLDQKADAMFNEMRGMEGP